MTLAPATSSLRTSDAPRLLQCGEQRDVASFHSFKDRRDFGGTRKPGQFHTCVESKPSLKKEI
jgi:hypothetical protein